MVNTVEDAAVPGKRAFRNPLDTPIVNIASRFGEKSKEVERFLRFAIVGASGAVIDFGMLVVLQATILPPNAADGSKLYLNVTLATSIAFAMAVLNNFIWTRLWVYPDSRTRSMRRQLAQFTLISVSGGVVRAVWVTSASFPLGHLLWPLVLPLVQNFRPEYLPGEAAEGKLGTIVAQLIGMAVIMLWNYFANRHWTYNDVS
jgi:putative flippase GtrA